MSSLFPYTTLFRSQMALHSRPDRSSAGLALPASILVQAWKLYGNGFAHRAFRAEALVQFLRRASLRAACGPGDTLRRLVCAPTDTLRSRESAFVHPLGRFFLRPEDRADRECGVDGRVDALPHWRAAARAVPRNAGEFPQDPPAAHANIIRSRR